MKIFFEIFCLAVAGMLLLVYWFIEYLPKSIILGTLLFATILALVLCGTIIVDQICQLILTICQLILTIINFFKKIFKILKKTLDI